MMYTTREFRKNLKQALDAAGDNGGVYVSRKNKKYIISEVKGFTVNIDSVLDVTQVVTKCQ